MKKIIILSSISLLVIFISVLPANAQTTGSDSSVAAGEMKFGAGLLYGTEVEQPGLRLDGVYRINKDFRAGLDLGFYLPDEQSVTFFGQTTTVTSNFLEINANAHYIYYNDAESGIMAYALAGLNFARVSVESEGSGGSSSNSDSETGINIGTGGEYALDFGDLFAEIKYDIGGFEQLYIAAGIKLSF